MNFSPGVFRKVSLDRLASPEQLDQLVRVVRVPGWILFAGVCIIFAAGLCASILAQVPLQVSGPIMLIEQSQSTQISTTVAGTLDGLFVGRGTIVEAGQLIAIVSISDTVTHNLRHTRIISPVSGRVLQANVPLRHALNLGDVIAQIGPLGEGNMHALMCVPFAQAQRLREGMPVQIALNDIIGERYGALEAEVLLVGQLSLPSDQAQAVCGPRDVAYTNRSDSSLSGVYLRLKESDVNPSGYVWTRGDGPPTKLSHASLGQATIVLGYVRPIELLWRQGTQGT